MASREQALKEGIVRGRGAQSGDASARFGLAAREADGERIRRRATALGKALRELLFLLTVELWLGAHVVLMAECADA